MPRARRQRLDAIQIASLGLLTFGVLLLLQQIGLQLLDALAWPAVLMVVGLAIIWRQLDDDAEARVRDAIGTSRTTWLRVGLGALFIAVGVGAFLALNDAVPALRQGLLATAALAAGLLLVFGPWWWRLGKELAEERRQRIRADERASVAAHVHDSVLQTLALIQRSAEDPAAVVRLARSQERELRSWLFGAPSRGGATLASALHRAAADVERDFDVTVELVVVGDAPLVGAAEALVLAVREAMVNAGKHADVSTVDVFVEVEPGRVTSFVRDRGVGFDLLSVPADRRGLLDSIKGRVERAGGHVRIRSASGEGTEVELEVPREREVNR